MLPDEIHHQEKLLRGVVRSICCFGPDRAELHEIQLTSLVEFEAKNWQVMQSLKARVAKLADALASGASYDPRNPSNTKQFLRTSLSRYQFVTILLQNPKDDIPM
jgi:hypothetical protein